ncbi:MAG: DUF669 domain-containing protein [Acutalibacteraceae bacterium]|nr:DUF669 domain-containing protein [Acidaminococcaceae bacterium]MEE3402551.1 DUF669 domain-containing protein [Acutalibacteraceae bacterium]
MFETNYSNIGGGETLPEGKYECVIQKAFVNAKGRTLFFQVTLIVRNDVPQAYQNRRIFHAIWQKKAENQTADDKKTDGYSFKQLMNLCESAGLPGGKSYRDLNELGSDLVGRAVQVDIVHDEWNGKISEKVKWCYRTNYPDCRHVLPQEAAPAQADGGTAAVVTADDDLPF